ncbi:MAG: hypothetical protein QXN62_04215 [Candidatus Bathyarchaeia archaeon]
MDGKLLFKDERCTGCRSCEIACSYHLSRKFQPSKSKIRVVWDSCRGEMKIFMGTGCDLCRNEKEGPLCVKYCAPRAILYEWGDVEI